MRQIRFRPGLHPRPHAEGADSAPPDPLAGFKGSTSKGREGEGKGSGGDGRVFSLYLSICGLRKAPGKFLMGILESHGKVLDFLSVKEWEPCAVFTPYF